MTQPIAMIGGLGEIADRYDALLCDAWGVIHNGVDLFPVAGEAMQAFREQRGPVIILTNAPRPSSIIPKQLDRLGLSRTAYDAVVTSGDATRAEIAARLPGKAYRIGPEKDDALYDGLDIEFAGPSDADFIICTGLVDDQTEQPDDYRDRLTALAARDLTMICANPDIIVNWGGRKVWCAGALAEIYREHGGQVVYGGKPHAPIYDLARRVIANHAGREVETSRLLAIGDGLGTDILGANKQNVDVLFVTGDGGIHGGGVDALSVSAALEKHAVSALAAIEGLAW